jgi:hypothetical protein
MAEDVNNPRPWKTIARELSQEHDPEKILALSLELNRVFENEDQWKKRQADQG